MLWGPGPDQYLMNRTVMYDVQPQHILHHHPVGQLGTLAPLSLSGPTVAVQSALPGLPVPLLVEMASKV